ncbi:preprotein translocase subunit SecG [Lysobacter sp. KIS68-7]|uniref:preprotein translocase subunit SecG n=1 Tax=Lysobacter sp. KIS68-7 TaxID=2904252 RepID=UPI001E5BBCEC|nr:preprotein translocase subunit SecG [Lysobacter sp. KIS68-7]UHQ18667.1 preprotein translocase subunit SecG [Lysobacter sp. KIS68-7]
MLMTILNVVYVLIAIAMVALILMQRGAGAQAGSGFGAGASATVFGSRGAGNFLSKSTKWLAIAFFVISLFMGWNATHGRKQTQAPAATDLGLMSSVPAAPATTKPSSAVPLAPAAAVPTAPAAVAPTNAVPAAPSTTKPSQGN